MGVVGDCWDRYMVRIEEMQQSARIVTQALDNLPEGDVHEAVPRNVKPPKDAEVYFRSESARGELGVYLISNGKNIPYRVKVKSPCFTAMSVFDEISRGYLLADIVAIVGSLDIVLGEIDR